uniref:Uncharacterized protein n=1 Tax=Aureoumbra lagunensis TaxID=44058 RepID=A0A7S3JU84_9STRA|mmetsp:Transcript_9734/g.14877  ORF Transcript_9734/g.14877 Transcript_9734/m.14877 type:complete len:189 (-) Transcript_9734:2194-2760(-)|eukprot:CAMPEP_0197302724 /NCGR_PEP_ID=MMETSP0890-20130614/51231_1 /TAXON_ID=44058 ORGANISM="Aureoumbra lagunensis, Strain CCMP1510" /NCGR_SAMPLE_ID=MMETSP0890 /ASSEMBLY_ACC=CAM_ASM_000533 /LENGTH=188 /DNA_ID=CAMNT_0042782405 /DNA_START=657 /DNA_END=1223 /DNA_ORIENTATION=-
MNSKEISGFGESDDDDNDRDEAVAEDKNSATQKDEIPSAALLLSQGVAAQWLKKPSWAQREEKIIPKAKTKQEQESRKRIEVDEDDSYGHDMYEFYDPAKGWQNKQSTNITDDNGGYALSSRSRSSFIREGSSTISSGKKRGNSISSCMNKQGKERVKQQRLSGQSGIGDDFRVWRSDEEMRLRQHFD